MTDLDPTAQLAKEMAEANKNLRETLSHIKNAKTQEGPKGHAEINVQAGGVGLFIAVTCCAIMLSLAIAGATLGTLAYFSTQQRLDRMQDYLNAIYMMAPTLKPKEDKK